jgi:hypothetical protein
MTKRRLTMRGCLDELLVAIENARENGVDSKVLSQFENVYDELVGDEGQQRISMQMGVRRTQVKARLKNKLDAMSEGERVGHFLDQLPDHGDWAEANAAKKQPRRR